MRGKAAAPPLSAGLTADTGAEVTVHKYIRRGLPDVLTAVSEPSTIIVPS